MKKTTKIVIGGLIILGAAIGYNIWNGRNAVTKKEFKEAMRRIDYQFDTVNIKLDTVLFIGKQNRNNILYLKNDNDSLKAGQILIYNQITEQSEKSFFNQLKTLFE